MREMVLENGVMLTFEDRSVRYFGDYWLMNILVTGSVADGNTRRQVFTRNLRQMAVPSARLAAAADDAVAGFMETAAEYISRPEFVQRGAEKMELESRKTCRRYR